LAFFGESGAFFDGEAGGFEGCRLGCSEAETQLSRELPGDGGATPGESLKTSSFRI
jgi:hypothetical protein